jgi:ATP-dependent RNA helicase DeaD
VLDEADEMLRMGFIEDVEWILEQSPPERQVALFSATLPREIRRIAAKHLKNPEEITVAVRTTTAECIRQRYWMVSGMHKLDALTRILEAEEFEAMIVFVRTKIATVELAEKLAARGYNAAALNGDLQQKQRELIIERLRSGKIEILVATDVAARGLDVDRISHVINYDIPCDTEAYVHRIGRTGRFGRNGDAILFIAPREKHLLYAIEKATRQKITLMELPSTEMINNQRINRFTQQITDRLAKNNLEFFNQLIEQYQHEHNVPAIEIAAALASLIQGETPMLLDKVPNEGKKERQERSPRREGRDSRHPERGSAHDKRDPGKPRDPDSRFSKPRQQRLDEPRQGKRKPEPSTAPVKAGLERYRLEVGKQHGVRPENIVGAIANEAGLDSRFIDRITIHETFSTVDLPEGMPRDVYRDLKKVWVAGRQLNINRMDADAEVQSPKKRRS